MAINQLTNEYVDVLSDSYLTAQITVGTTAVEAKCGTSKLENRELLLIHNSSNNTIYFGPSGVTTSTGIPIRKNETVSLAAGLSVYLIASQNGNEVIVQELS